MCARSVWAGSIIHQETKTHSGVFRRTNVSHEVEGSMSTGQKNRRGFLSLITKCLMTLLGLCLAVPALASICGPLWRKHGKKSAGESFRDVGAIKDLPLGEWRLLQLESVTANGWERSGVHR